MYLRIVKGTVQADQLDEMAKRWEANVGARIRQQPGFRHAYFTGNRETGAVMGVTLWDTLPDDAVMRPVMQEFQTKIADISAGGAPTIENYEVLVEL
jgi:hypothetical protein